jgi:rhodanese-related sulfurtransferase
VQHSPRFLKLAESAKGRVNNITVDDVKPRIDRGERFNLLDVREESEFAAGHLPGAVHMGRGVIERDIEKRFPDTGTELVLYCGGGYRSALTAESLQKMGYTNVKSMDGGFRGWTDKGYEVERP